MSVRERVWEHRKRLRAQGLRPIQIRVADARTDACAEEARRQAVLVSAANAVSDDQDFVEAISTTWDD